MFLKNYRSDTFSDNLAFKLIFSLINMGKKIQENPFWVDKIIEMEEENVGSPERDPKQDKECKN